MSELPHWDLTNIYPSLESSEFEAAVIDMRGQLDEMTSFLAASVAATDVAATLAEGIERFNKMLQLEHTIQSYIYSFVSTDSRNSLARKKMSEFNQLQAQSQTLFTQWQAQVGKLLPPVSRHFIDQRLFAIHHLVMRER